MKKTKQLLSFLLAIFLFASLTVTSSCDKAPEQEKELNEIVAVPLGSFAVADRNAGATQEGPAYNYTNDQSHSDYNNAEFKGGYYTWEQAKIACTDPWRLPTKAELETINNEMTITDGRAYLEDTSAIGVISLCLVARKAVPT